MKSLRKSLENNEHILTSLAMIDHGGAVDILFPLAAFDLNELLFNKRRCELFTEPHPKDAAPTHLLNEMAGVADALGYLHERLYLSNNQRIICVHMDMKPDNVLVFYHPSTPCGRWKISDFGLSRIKPSKQTSDVSSSGARPASYRFSNTLAQRYPGTFQAPEIETAKKTKKRTIGPRCDIWGLGCILILVVAYALGREELVKEFDRERSRGRSNGKSKSLEYDYFYREGGRELKPEVTRWLEGRRHRDGRNEAWLESCIKLIKDILRIEPAMRPAASEIRKRILEEVVGKMGPKSPESDFSSPSTASLVESKSLTHTFTGTAPARSSLQAKIPYPLSDVRYLKSTFAKVKLPSGKVVQTAISSCDGYLVFLFDRSFYAASVKRLETSQWSATPQSKRATNLDEYVLHETISEHLKWHTMVLSGSFLILSGWDASTKQRVVCATILSYNSIPIIYHRAFLIDHRYILVRGL